MTTRRMAQGAMRRSGVTEKQPGVSSAATLLPPTLACFSEQEVVWDPERKHSLPRMVFPHELLPVFLPPTSTILTSERGLSFSVGKKFQKHGKQTPCLLNKSNKITLALFITLKCITHPAETSPSAFVSPSSPVSRRLSPSLFSPSPPAVPSLSSLLHNAGHRCSQPTFPQFSQSVL